MPFMYPFMAASMMLPVSLWFMWVYDPLTRGCMPWE